MSPNTQERPEQRQKTMRIIHRLLPYITLPIRTMIIQPQEAREHNRQRRKTDTSRQCDQVVEDRYRLSEDEGDGC